MIFTTEDGSHSMRSAQFDEAYHSKYGALQESQHVFIEAGLQYLVDKGKTTISIFEMGMGTGLNVLLTLLYAEKHQIKIDYKTVEAFPILDWSELNYPKLLREKAAVYFDKIHLLSPMESKVLSPYFTLTKFHQKLEELTFETASFDLIYYDAFAPAAQEELWTEVIFEKLFSAMKPNGVLTTYCAKGSVKRALKAAGFTVEGIPGPPGKREMTRAVVG